MKKYLTLIILLQFAATSFAAGPRVSSTSDGVDNLRVIEYAYLIGSFNDWKLPDGDDLNGARKIEFDREYSDECRYRWRGTLPAGDVSFMVYVPESANLTEVDYSGFYTTPCRQFPIYEPDQEYDYQWIVPDFWCERSEAPDLYKACMIPDWSGGEVRVCFSACSRDYMDGICFELSVSGDSRLIPTPDVYYFIASVNGGEPEVFGMEYLHLGGPDAKYEYHFRGYYMQDDYIYDAVTISGYFSPEPSLDVDPSRCLGACGPETLTLDPSNFGPYFKEMSQSGALYLSPGKNPITVNIIAGEKVHVSGLNIYNWTVEFYSFEKQGSVEGIPVDTYNQIAISDNAVTVPTPTQINLYGLGGVKVLSGYGTRLELGDLGHGTYIVRAGAFSRKVAL